MLGGIDINTSGVNHETSGDSFATGNIWALIAKYSIPAVVSGLVGSLYNIVDQIFIGRGLGYLGMAATNVAFPFTTICLALALTFGVGGAVNMNLLLGKGESEKARSFAGNTIFLSAASGVFIALVSLVFLEPLLSIFGATEATMGYTKEYAAITALGFPFFIFSIVAGKLIRSDGSPIFSMVCVLSGAVFNCIGTPIFIFVLGMGIKGAALATVLGQALSSSLALYYFAKKARVIKLNKQYLKPMAGFTGLIVLSGVAPGINQIAVTFIQIALNNLLTYHGQFTSYGSDLPLAAAGATTKVFAIFFTLVLGVAQGCQPIIGFNYGAKNYGRVKEIYGKAAITVFLISLPVLVCFQLFPTFVLSVFGTDSEAFYEFGSRFLRINFMMLPLIAVQVVTANFFVTIGKPLLGLVMTISRQLALLLPLMFIFSHIIGLNGILYAGPVADMTAFIITAVFIAREMGQISEKIKK
ncbi:MAG: MATE family efflux transporter [Oscillospiraceae bacterium]|nr:MATE family efflux transporter [Oscillospiraceae bacterium]